LLWVYSLCLLSHKTTGLVQILNLGVFCEMLLVS
jgi:hypothetical protein